MVLRVRTVYLILFYRRLCDVKITATPYNHGSCTQATKNA